MTFTYVRGQTAANRSDELNPLFEGLCCVQSTTTQDSVTENKLQHTSALIMMYASYKFHLLSSPVYHVTVADAVFCFVFISGVPVLVLTAWVIPMTQLFKVK